MAIAGKPTSRELLCEILPVNLIDYPAGSLELKRKIGLVIDALGEWDNLAVEEQYNLRCLVIDLLIFNLVLDEPTGPG